MAKLMTTAQAAAAVGIDRATLQEWIRLKRVTPPALSIVDGHAVRLWSPSDLKQVREVKSRTYRRGRGRKKAGAPVIAVADSNKGRDEALNRQSLLNYRDYFLSLLAQGWGEVGQSLPRASTVEELRTALSPLLDVGPYSFRLPPFVRANTTPATRSQIAEAANQLRKLNQIRSRLQTDLHLAKDDHAQSKQALMSGATSQEREGALRGIHFTRLFAYAQRQQEWNQLQTQCRALEESLADGVAHYVQHQLLGFLKSSRRYARDAENIAGAMAGLPELTASYSFQRCAKEPPQSPSANVEIFRVVATSWRQADGSVSALASILPKAIQAITIDYVRMQLQAEWWYLLQAVLSITDFIDKEDVPFRVFSEYQKRRIFQTAETMAFANEARLDAIRAS